MITGMQVVLVGVDAGVEERVQADVRAHRYPEEMIVSMGEGVEPIVIRRVWFAGCSCGCRFCVYMTGDYPDRVPCPACRIEFEVRRLAL